MINDPEMFTTMVPHGNVWPNRLAIKSDTPQRARLPNPPPIKIQSAFHIIPARQIRWRKQELSALNGSGGFPKSGKANPIACRSMGVAHATGNKEVVRFQADPAETDKRLGKQPAEPFDVLQGAAGCSLDEHP